MTGHNRSGPHHYAYIDALRGYAVLGVISVHTAESVPALQGHLRALAYSGLYGVQLFFVVSALTLMLSWHARSDGAWPFLIRRIFRIAPMFWLAIAFYLLFYGFRARYFAPNGVSWEYILATATFLHGWDPSTINSVVPGGWSIAVEMTFYALFPLLAYRLTSLTWVGGAFIVSTILAHLLNPVAARIVTAIFSDQPQYLVSSFTYFWIVNQLPIFLIGFAAFFVLRKFTLSTPIGWAGAVLSIAMIILMPFIHIPGPTHIKYGLCFGVLAVCLGSGAGRGIVNPVIRWLGKLSYSAYLWHFSVLMLLKDALRWTGPWKVALGLDTPSQADLLFLILLLAVVSITAALSLATYNIVEQPMIAQGSKVVRLWRSRSVTRLEIAA